MTTCILVPLDGSERARVALPVARRLAELGGHTLRLLHVTRETWSPEEVAARVGLDADELRGTILDARVGEPAAGIVEAARDPRAAVIVMCTQTSRMPAGRTMGSTALAVLKSTRCPVVLVRPERGLAPWALRRILVPHDGTPVTSASMPRALELARSAGAALDVLHVAAPGATAPGERGSLTTPRYMDQAQHEWPEWAREFVERLGSMCSTESLNLRLAVARGNPGNEVRRFAEEHASDLVVVAWRGEWEGERAAIVKSLVGRLKAPVLIVRAGERRADAQVRSQAAPGFSYSRNSS